MSFITKYRYSLQRFRRSRNFKTERDNGSIIISQIIKQMNKLRQKIILRMKNYRLYKRYIAAATEICDDDNTESPTIIVRKRVQTVPALRDREGGDRASAFFSSPQVKKSRRFVQSEGTIVRAHRNVTPGHRLSSHCPALVTREHAVRSENGIYPSNLYRLTDRADLIATPSPSYVTLLGRYSQ